MIVPHECKIHIMPPLIDGPYGGGNQFAKALKIYFNAQNKYEENLSNANVVLFNGFPFRERGSFQKALEWKVERGSSGIIIVRLDGPISKGRNNPEADYFDCVLYDFCNLVADAIVIQSDWSKSEILSHKAAPTCPNYVIGNAVDSKIFFKPKKKKRAEKFRLITTSWSNNPQKGFLIYEWLDENLNFDEIEYTIIGNSVPVFDNIVVKAPMPQEKLAEELRQHDVFINASLIESCSNASLEALNCGLPVIAPNSSSHPQYVSNQDLLFNKKEEVPEKIKKLRTQLKKYSDEISVKKIDDVGSEYLKVIFSTLDIKGKVVEKRQVQEFLIKNNLIKPAFQNFVISIKKLVRDALFK